MIRGGYWGGAWGLSWGGAWGEAWLLLNQPYQELSLKGQVFVRSYLSSIHSVEVAERIVSVAALNNISVIDAEVVVAAKRVGVKVGSVKKRSQSRIQLPVPASMPERNQPISLAAECSQRGLFCQQTTQSISAKAEHTNLVATQTDTRVDLTKHFNE